MTLQTYGPVFLEAELEEFVTRCMEGLSHQVRGDSPPFQAVWSHADDVTILGAIGSYSKRWDDVSTHLFGASRSLDRSDLSVERLLTIASGDLAVSVVLEHVTREVDGNPDARTLRTTQAYRRESGGWRLIHRHTNPLTPEDEARERTLLADERAVLSRSSDALDGCSSRDTLVPAMPRVWRISRHSRNELPRLAHDG